MNFSIQSVETTVEFTYPWLPLMCGSCGKWGHSEKICSLNKMERMRKKKHRNQRQKLEEEQKNWKEKKRVKQRKK